MKKALSTIAIFLISLSVTGSGYNYIPIAMSEADIQNPIIMLNLANTLCMVFGYPESDEARAKAVARFKLTKVENVVGNPDEGVTAGSTWYISADAGANLLGDDISEARSKLEKAFAKKMGDTKFGDITEDPQLWFSFWGIVTQTTQ